MEDSRQSIEQNLQAAIRRHDLELLARIYTDAANASEQRGNIDEACFFLTQAYVCALQQGSDQAHKLRLRLIEHGRES